MNRRSPPPLILTLKKARNWIRTNPNFPRCVSLRRLVFRSIFTIEFLPRSPRALCPRTANASRQLSREKSSRFLDFSARKRLLGARVDRTGSAIDVARWSRGVSLRKSPETRSGRVTHNRERTHTERGDIGVGGCFRSVTTLSQQPRASYLFYLSRERFVRRIRETRPCRSFPLPPSSLRIDEPAANLISRRIV